MRSQLFLLAILLTPAFIGCSDNKGEEVVLQEGKNPDGSPEKLRQRLTITDARGVMYDQACVSALPRPSNPNNSTELAAAVESCAVSGDDGRGGFWNNFWSFYIPYYYSQSYYHRPYSNGTNYGCAQIWPSWGNSLSYNCFNNIFGYGYNYAGTSYNNYCYNYCSWNGVQNWSPQCWGCGR